MRDDARRAYLRDEQTACQGTGDPEDRAQLSPGAPNLTELERSAMIETAIQQAIRRGEFDNLPGAGKPLSGLDKPRDPDWWIKQKIEDEQLTGLGPAALTLRVEDAKLEATLDAMTREADVRAALEDFNQRVIEAQRQLLGGPPVVTQTRDVEAELRAWRDRRTRPAIPAPHESTDSTAPARRGWWATRRIRKR